MRHARRISTVLIAIAMILSPVASRGDSPGPTVVSPPESLLAQGTTAGPTGVDVSTGFAPALIVVTLSGSLEYTNLDALGTHNLISVAKTTDPATWDPRYCDALKPITWQPGDPLPSCALFQDWSPDTDFLGSRNVTQSAPVLLQMADGTPKLQPDVPYVFFCSFHPNMRGTLIAVSN